MATRKNKCTNKYDITNPVYATRVAELRAIINHKDKKKYGLQGLRNILAELRGDPTDQPTTVGARTQNELIALILCI